MGGLPALSRYGAVAERGAVGRVFHAFANAVLARTLPTVREWLASRFGPHATVGAMELDGSRVRLRDARLPIGPTAVLEVDVATFMARPSESAPLLLERLEGRLVVPDDEGGTRFCAPLVLDGEAAPTGAEWVHGVVTVTDARWTASAGRDAQAPLSGTVVATVTSSEWSLTDGVATAADAHVTLSGAGRLDDPGRGVERAHLEAKGARVGHFVDAMSALAGRAPKIGVPLPWTGLCDARLDLEGRTLSARVDVRTPGSRLHVDAEIVDGRVTSAHLDGALAWEDLVPARALALVGASAPVTCAGELAGALDALSGEVRLTCPRVVARPLREDLALDAKVTLDEGAAYAVVDLAFERAAGAVRVDASLGVDGALAGTLSGSVDPAVVDPEVGVLAGDRVRVQGTIAGTRAVPTLDVRARADALSFTRGGATLALERVTVDARWHDGPYVDLGARLGSGTVQIEPLEKRLSAARVDAASCVAFARSRGVDWLRRGGEPAALALFALPDDAEVDAELTWGDGWRGSVTVATPRSRISIEPLVFAEDGRWDGSVVRGRLAAVDALTVGLFPGPFRPRPQGLATLELPMFGAGVDTFVEGRLTTASLSWEFYEGATPVELSAAAAGLRVDGDAVTLTELEGRVFGGALALDLRIAYPRGAPRIPIPTGRVVVDGAREGLGAWLRGMLGRSRVPAGLALDMELETDAAGRLRGPVVLSNQHSRVTLALALDAAGGLEGSILDGEVSLTDLYELFERGGPSVVGKGNLELKGTLEGTWDAPEVALRAFCEQPRLMIAWGKGARVSLDRVLLRARWSRERFVWSELLAEGYGGRVKSQGLVGWGSGFRGLQAKIDIDDVQVGALPLPGGGRVGAHLSGRGNGSLTLRRKPGEAMSGKGQLWIEDPVFPVLELAEPALAKYGLKPPPIAGTESLLADVRGGPEAWLLKGLGGAVRGARVDGDLALRSDGQLLGAFDVSLETAYLRSSAILRVPATVVGDVRIPVRVRGPVSRPAIEADLVGTLDHLVSKSRLGRGLQRAVDGVMDKVVGERERHAPAEDIERFGDEALILRIARGIGDEERQIEILIDRGLSPTEIADRIEAARRR